TFTVTDDGNPSTVDLTLTSDLLGRPTSELTKTGNGVLGLSGLSISDTALVAAVTVGVTAGTVSVNGNYRASPFHVIAGTLQGIGSIGALTASAGRIAPGDAAQLGPSALDVFGNVTLGSGTLSPIFQYVADGLHFTSLRVNSNGTDPAPKIDLQNARLVNLG